MKRKQIYPDGLHHGVSWKFIFLCRRIPTILVLQFVSPLIPSISSAPLSSPSHIYTLTKSFPCAFPDYAHNVLQEEAEEEQIKQQLQAKKASPNEDWDDGLTFTAKSSRKLNFVVSFCFLWIASPEGVDPFLL